MKQTVLGLYDWMEDAQKAVRELKDGGFNSADISLVAHDVGGEYGRTLVKTDGADGAAAGAATGATAGAVLGGITGLLVGLGALVIPGIGPVIAAGPLAAAVATLVGAGTGAVAGGVAGGLLGALVDLGVPEEEAHYYAEGVRRGGALVTVHTDDTMADRARSIMERFHPINVKERAETWREAGWKSYDTSAKPYTAKEIEQERKRYAAASTAMGGVRSYNYTSSRTPSDMERYSTAWRGHYQTNFARSGNKYEQYEPAYQYGYTLRNDPRYRDYDWNRLEPEARTTWDARHTGTAWDQIKGAVRYAWENVKQAMRD